MVLFAPSSSSLKKALNDERNLSLGIVGKIKGIAGKILNPLEESGYYLDISTGSIKELTRRELEQRLEGQYFNGNVSGTEELNILKRTSNRHFFSTKEEAKSFRKRCIEEAIDKIYRGDSSGIKTLSNFWNNSDGGIIYRYELSEMLKLYIVNNIILTKANFGVSMVFTPLYANYGQNNQILVQGFHCLIHDLNPDFQAPLAWAIINGKIDSSIIRRIISTVGQEHYNEFISEFYNENLVEELAKEHFRSIGLNNFSL